MVGSSSKGDDGSSPASPSTTTLAMASADLPKSLLPLLPLLDQKDYYSFHQKLRTSAARLQSAPRRRAGASAAGASPAVAVEGHLPFDDKAKEAAALLWEGSRRLLEQGQLGSGVDAAGLLVDLWKTRGVECSTEERGERSLLLCSAVV